MYTKAYFYWKSDITRELNSPHYSLGDETEGLIRVQGLK